MKTETKHLYKMCDIIQDSLLKKGSALLDYIELRTQLNQFEMFVEYWKMSILVFLNEDSIEGKSCINREIKSL